MKDLKGERDGAGEPGIRGARLQMREVSKSRRGAAEHGLLRDHDPVPNT